MLVLGDGLLRAGEGDLLLLARERAQAIPATVDQGHQQLVPTFDRNADVELAIESDVLVRVEVPRCLRHSLVERLGVIEDRSMEGGRGQPGGGRFDDGKCFEGVVDRVQGLAHNPGPEVLHEDDEALGFELPHGLAHGNRTHLQ